MADDPEGARAPLAETDDNLVARAAEGTRAKALLENPLLKRVLADIRKAHALSYSEVPITDVDALIVHRLYVHVMDQFVSDLHGFAADGKAAEFDLRQRQGARDKAQERRDQSDDPEPRYAINADFQEWQRRRRKERERADA